MSYMASKNLRLLVVGICF